MTLAIGLGCRRSCPAHAIVALVVQACDGLDMTQARLFTIEAKRHEEGIRGAAAALGIPLVFMAADDLRAALPGVTVRSEAVESAVGVSSVAEAAALAGAGTGAKLLVPRLAAGGATCAVAAGPGTFRP